MTDRSDLPQAVLGRQALHGVLIAELDHPDGVVRVHTGTTNIFIDGNEYAGAGGLLVIEGITDGAISTESHTWTMGLARAAPALTPYVLDNSLRDRGVRLSVSVSDDGVDWETPVAFKTGRISAVVVNEEGISAECVTAGVDLQRVRQRHILWTDEQQRAHVDANDVSFRNVASIGEIELAWP